MSTYGVINRNGDYNDVSKTERGAKNYASRHGYNEVYIRFNSGYHIELVATKHNNKWSK